MGSEMGLRLRFICSQGDVGVMCVSHHRVVVSVHRRAVDSARVLDLDCPMIWEQSNCISSAFRDAVGSQ